MKNEVVKLKMTLDSYEVVAKELSWSDDSGDIGASELSYIFDRYSDVCQRIWLDIGPSSRLQKAFREICPTIESLAHSARKEGESVAWSLNKPNPKFCFSGIEVNLRSSSVDSIYGILSHLINNSIDHGIETPRQRLEAGKRDVGELHLNAQIVDRMIQLQWSDDGQGLNLNALRNRATDRGFPGVRSMSDQELARLILVDGFSTKETVSAISGRGVGLSAVRSIVSELGGEMDMILGESTSSDYRHITFMIRIPIVHAVLFHSNKRESSAPLETKKIDILLVDDDQVQLLLMKKTILRLRLDKPYTLHSASTFEQALELARINDYAVIISDITLGTKSGFDLCRTVLDLCRKESRPSPRFIGMTASIHPEFESLKATCGMESLMEKKSFDWNCLKEFFEETNEMVAS